MERGSEFHAMIEKRWFSRYVHRGHAEKTLYCYENMQLEEVSSDAITFILGFQACNDVESTDKAQEIHSQLVKRGFFETNVVIGKSLLDICAKCGLVVGAT
mgnify:CR=1 FL=1